MHAIDGNQMNPYKPHSACLPMSSDVGRGENKLQMSFKTITKVRMSISHKRSQNEGHEAS